MIPSVHWGAAGKQMTLEGLDARTRLRSAGKIAAADMTLANKIFGVLLFGVAIPLATHIDSHIIVYVLLANASTIFILFSIQLSRVRCRQCGHYSKMNIWDKYIMGKHPAICKACREISDTVISTCSPDPERIITPEVSGQNRD